MTDIDIAKVRRAIAPSGTLRTTINVGNPILASRKDVPGGVAGVSVDLARTLAERLDVPLELVVLGQRVRRSPPLRKAVPIWAFRSRSHARATDCVHCPYVLIEGCYLVRDGSPVSEMKDIDVAGRRVVVGKGSAYDLYLTRELRHATIERAATSPPSSSISWKCQPTSLRAFVSNSSRTRTGSVDYGFCPAALW